MPSSFFSPWIRQLSHGLLTLNSVSGTKTFTEGQTHQYTYIRRTATDSILGVTKSRSAAEFLQLARRATWDHLDSSFDSTQLDTLEGMFRF